MYIHTYVSHTDCGIRTVVATRSTSMLLLPRCSQAPTERHSSPVEAVLSGSEVAFLGLIEIPKSPDVGRRYKPRLTQLIHLKEVGSSPEMC